MRVNEDENRSYLLKVIEISQLLTPLVSENDKGVAQFFSDFESAINNDQDILVTLLKYSFFLRYLSNNQVLVYSGLLSVHLPHNLHLSTQALSAGMKPLSEKYFS